MRHNRLDIIKDLKEDKKNDADDERIDRSRVFDPGFLVLVFCSLIALVVSPSLWSPQMDYHSFIWFAFNPKFTTSFLSCSISCLPCRPFIHSRWFIPNIMPFVTPSFSFFPLLSGQMTGIKGWSVNTEPDISCLPTVIHGQNNHKEIICGHFRMDCFWFMHQFPITKSLSVLSLSRGVDMMFHHSQNPSINYT